MVQNEVIQKEKKAILLSAFLMGCVVNKWRSVVPPYEVWVFCKSICFTLYRASWCEIYCFSHAFHHQKKKKKKKLLDLAQCLEKEKRTCFLLLSPCHLWQGVCSWSTSEYYLKVLSGNWFLFIYLFIYFWHSFYFFFPCLLEKDSL